MKPARLSLNNKSQGIGATMVQRYGTSCAERDDGCFVKFEDYAALEGQVRALRAKLETPIAMKIKWSPLESTMIDGWSDDVAEDALKRGKKVTGYYGETRIHKRAKEQA